MLSGVLNSERAIQVNIQIMRAFTQLCRLLATHADLKKKIEAMEKKYDENFRIVFEAIGQLLEADEAPRKKIGYTVKEKQNSYVKAETELLDSLDLTPKGRATWRWQWAKHVLNLDGMKKRQCQTHDWCLQREKDLSLRRWCIGLSCERFYSGVGCR